MPTLDEYAIAITANTANTGGFTTAMRNASRSFHKLSTAFLPPNDRRKHTRRCRTCNPSGYPKPLRVNGADYHRRRNNRRSRK